MTFWSMNTSINVNGVYTECKSDDISKGRGRGRSELVKWIIFSKLFSFLWRSAFNVRPIQRNHKSYGKVLFEFWLGYSFVNLSKREKSNSESESGIRNHNWFPLKDQRCWTKGPNYSIMKCNQRYWLNNIAVRIFGK